MNRQAFFLIPKAANRQNGKMAVPLGHWHTARAREVAAAIARGDDAAHLIQSISGAWSDSLYQIKKDDAIRFGVHGYQLGSLALGKKSAVRDVLAKAKGKADVQIAFGADEIIANHLRANIKDYVWRTSKLETQTTAEKFQRIIRDGMASKDTRPAVLAQEFMDAALALTESRAMLMATTLTNWAYNDGATTLYRDEGFDRKEWLLTDDDKTCEFCLQMDTDDNRSSDINIPFWGKGQSLVGANGGRLNFGLEVDHPPLHPNCRCTLIPAE